MEDNYEETSEFFDNNFDDDGPAGGKDDQLNNLFEKENDQVKKKVAKSRRQPKLDEATLMGPKGIEALRDSFKSFRPDLKKDPYDNLHVMIKKYEHWAHCMFPKLKFEDVINRCEQLGEKRAVKVYMMKSRFGIPLTDEDFAPLQRTTRDEVIETENNEDDFTRASQQFGSDDDENYYDPLQSTTSTGKSKEGGVSLKSTLSPAVTSHTDFGSDVKEELIQSALEARRIGTVDERNRNEEEELAMADEIMADFDMY